MFWLSYGHAIYQLEYQLNKPMYQLPITSQYYNEVFDLVYYDALGFNSDK